MLKKELRQLIDHYLKMVYSACRMSELMDDQDSEEIDGYIEKRCKEYKEKYSDCDPDDIMLEALMLSLEAKIKAEEHK